MYFTLKAYLSSQQLHFKCSVVIIARDILFVPFWESHTFTHVHCCSISCFSEFAGAAVTKCHKLGRLSPTEIYFSKFWGLDVPNQSARGPLPHRPLIVSSRGRRTGEHWRIYFIRAAIPFMRVPPTWPSPLSKAASPNTNAWTLGGHKHSNHSSAQK